MDLSLYTAKRTQLQMLEKRGFDISHDRMCLDMSLQEANDYYSGLIRPGQTYRNLLSNSYEAIPESIEGETGVRKQAMSNRAIVYYAKSVQGKEINVENIKPFVQMIERGQNPKYAIMIVDAQLNSAAKKEIDKIIISMVQIFQEKDLQFNVLEHIWVPRHVPMTSSEMVTYLAQGVVRLNQLPILRYDDPVAKFLGLFPGTIVRIYRQNPTSDATIEEEIGIRVVSNK